MGDWVGGAGKQPALAARWPARLSGQDGGPAVESRLHDVGRQRILLVNESTLDHDALAVVADEVCRVDFHADDDAAADTQLYDDPVVLLLIVAACLPAVVPGSGVDEDARAVDRRGGSEEV